MTAAQTANGGVTPARILVVEDDLAVREYYVRVLRICGYEVAFAENGRIAAQYLAEPGAYFDLVLTDVQMPEMSGIALLQHMLDCGYDADSIVFTAHAHVESARQALKLGATDYLTKPVSMEDLERAVRRSLEMRRIRKEKERLSELVTMYEFSQRIASSLNIEAQVPQILALLGQRFAPETISLSLIDPDERRLDLIGVTGLRPLKTSHPLPEDVDEGLIVAAHMQMLPMTLAESLDAGKVAMPALRTNDRTVGMLRLTRGADQPPFALDDRKLLSIFATQVAASLETARLYEALKNQNLQTVAALAAAIDARDPYTLGHSEQVMHYSVMLAQHLGMPGPIIERIRYGALLHDIGKIGIRDHILLKPGRLTDEEYLEMKRHTVIGAEIIVKIKALHGVIPLVRCHHERMDGRGYLGYTAEHFPLEARIISIADAFDAMTSHRAYRKAMSLSQAFEQLLLGRGTQWDARLVDAFIALEHDPQFQQMLTRARPTQQPVALSAG